MVRLLNDVDINDVINFEKTNIIRNGKEFYCDIEMNKIYLSDAPMLRKCMFDGTIMFVGEYNKEQKLEKLCMFALPYQSTKSTVVKIFFCNKDAIFVKNAIDVFCDFIEGSFYTKIRITTYGINNKNSILDIIEENELICESVVDTNLGQRYVYSKYIMGDEI